MHPIPQAVLRDFHRVHEDEDRRELRRIHDAALDANEAPVEPERQSRFAVMRVWLQERVPKRTRRLSRPAEPSSV